MERHEVPGVVMGSLGLGDLFARVGLDRVDKVDEFDGIYLSAKFWDLIQKLTLDEEDGNVVSDCRVSKRSHTEEQEHCLPRSQLPSSV